MVVGVAASGRTPFTVAAVQYARRHGAKTIAVTCNRNSPLEKAAHLAIVAEVGPEVISGSTRMKAGTAQKMVLNMLSTGAMTRLGYVYGNLMVNVHRKNQKAGGARHRHCAAGRGRNPQRQPNARCRQPETAFRWRWSCCRRAAPRAMPSAP